MDRTAVFIFRSDSGYNERDMRKMLSQCKRNCITEFIIITDVSNLFVSADVIYVMDNPRLELLPPGKYLYLDLSVTVNKTLRNLYDRQHTLTKYNNSIVLWDGNYEELLKNYTPDSFEDGVVDHSSDQNDITTIFTIT